MRFIRVLTGWVGARVAQWQWPVIVLLIYASAIFWFARLYFSWPADFYHPYVIREEPVVELRTQLRRYLTRAFQKVLVEQCASISDRLGTMVRIPPRGCQVLDITADQRYLRTTLVVPLLERKGDGIHDGTLVLPISVYCGDEIVLYGIALANTVEPVGDVQTQVRNDDHPISDTHLFDIPEERWPNSDISMMTRFKAEVMKALSPLEISTTFMTDVDAFRKAERGVPYMVSDQFSRMLYFSAVTITTVGYGDIVPMTGRARRACALEATLGVILLGWFVTVCASAAQKKCGSRENGEHGRKRNQNTENGDDARRQKRHLIRRVALGQNPAMTPHRARVSAARKTPGR